MKCLTTKEEEIMSFFWTKKVLFIKELTEMYSKPKPHFNTLSTYVRSLKRKGFLGHEVFGRSYRYFTIIDKERYRNEMLRNIIQKYFDNSYSKIILLFIQNKNITVNELNKILDEIEFVNCP